MQNKPNLLDARTNVSSAKATNYEQITMNNANKNKAKQTRSEAEIPTGELLGILKPGTKG
jgi:hypothetical protein